MLPETQNSSISMFCANSNEPFVGICCCDWLLS